MVENERDYYCVVFFSFLDRSSYAADAEVCNCEGWTRCSVTRTKQLALTTTKTEPSKMWKNVRFTPSDKSLLNERSVAVHKYPFIHGHMGAHRSLLYFLLNTVTRIDIWPANTHPTHYSEQK